MRGLLRRFASRNDILRALRNSGLVINEESRKGMKEIFERIQDGSFVTEWLLENQAGAPRFKRSENKMMITQ